MNGNNHFKPIIPVTAILYGLISLNNKKSYEKQKILRFYCEIIGFLSKNWELLGIFSV